MSNVISTFLKLHPLLTSYTQKGLINLNALSRYIKENNNQVESSTSIAAVGMDLRRYLANLPKVTFTPVIFSRYSLQLVVRTNINEVVLNKNIESRKWCSSIVQKIYQTKYFVSIVEGEREMIIMTDYPLKELLNKDKLKTSMIHYTDELSFISINFPIELRLVSGVYNIITASLAEVNIPIHSFHTIGGEILILVKNDNLAQTQEILQSILTYKA